MIEKGDSQHRKKQADKKCRRRKMVKVVMNNFEKDLPLMGK